MYKPPANLAEIDKTQASWLQTTEPVDTKFNAGDFFSALSPHMLKLKKLQVGPLFIRWDEVDLAEVSDQKLTER